MSYDFKNAQELLELCANNNLKISQVMVKRETELFGTSEEEVYAKMEKALGIMKSSTHGPLETAPKTMGGLIGGEAKKLYSRYKSGKSICGSLMSKVNMYAMAVLEVNASMGVIVAAPTAGSSGVLPAVLIALMEEYDMPSKDVCDALLTSSAIGALIMRNASVAGAEAGCQAEVGAASAMAAAAAAELMGGTPHMCVWAATTAIMNVLGLVCDPIAGLVEAPCQTRNAMGASNAVCAAETALAGIPSVIPFDEAIDTMYRIGKNLPRELRETALGGCAATPTGKEKARSIFGS